MTALDMIRLLECVENIQKTLSCYDAYHGTSSVYVFFYDEDLVALGLDGHTFFWQKIPYTEEFKAKFPHKKAALIDYSQYAQLLKIFKPEKKAGVECVDIVTADSDGYSTLVFMFDTGADPANVSVTFVEESNFESVKSLYRRMVCREYTQAELATKEWALDTTEMSYVYSSTLLLTGQFFDRKMRRNDSENPINITEWMVTYKGKKNNSEAIYLSFTARDNTHGCVTMNIRLGR